MTTLELLASLLVVATAIILLLADYIHDLHKQRKKEEALRKQEQAQQEAERLDYQKLWMDGITSAVQTQSEKKELRRKLQKAEEESQSRLKLAAHYRNLYYDLLD